MRRLSVVVVSVIAFATAASAQTPPTDPLGPRTLVPALVMCTDLPVLMSPEVTLRVVGGQMGDLRQSFARNDIVVLPGGTTDNINIGQRYIARRLKGGVYADTVARAGYVAVRTSGVITVIASDHRYALARVDYGCDEVVQGDFLEPYAETALPTRAEEMPEPGGWNFDDRARVLFGSDRREMFGDGDVFSFNRGSEHGIVIGARVGIYRDRRIGQPLLPLVEMGNAVVVEVSTTTSKAVVIKLLGDRIESNDVIVRKK